MLERVNKISEIIQVKSTVLANLLASHVLEINALLKEIILCKMFYFQKNFKEVGNSRNLP